MARNQWEDLLRGALTGVVQGASAGMASGRELEKAMMLEKLKSAMSPEESALKKAQAEQATAMSELLRGFKGQGTDIASEEDAILNQLPTGESKEDYIVKPIIRSVRGIPQRISTLERKPNVPIKQLSDIKDMDTNIYELERNLETLTRSPSIKQFIGPGIVQRPGAIADILTQFGAAPEGFATFKADVDKSFQKYRKWVTGVQAGYPELQWLVVDFPKPTDKAHIFISKSLSAIETMKKNKEIFLDYLSANNYATSKLKKMSGKSLFQPPQSDDLISVINPSGKRVKIKSSRLESALRKGYKK